MWLLTKHGAYSLVKKSENQFHVRARVRWDLENLVERVPLPDAAIHFRHPTRTGTRSDMVNIAQERPTNVLGRTKVAF